MQPPFRFAISLILTFLAAVACLIPLPMATAAATDDPGELSLRPTLPLNEEQRNRLRQIVSTDPEATAIFSSLKKEAASKLDLSPNPIPVLHYEGLLNTESRRIATVASLREMDDCALLLHYWQATGDPAAAATLCRFITSWAEIYQPTGNDVNENKLYPLFTAYEALRPTFPPETKAVIDSWVERLGDLHVKQVKTSTHLTNRYTKHIRLVAMFGRILERAEWQQAAVAGFKRFVTESLRPDGTSLDLERRDTLTYHTSALRPLIELAVIGGDEGAALYTWESPSGSSLKKSVDYVVPFAEGTKTREEWRNTTLDLDRRRAAAGIEAYRQGRLYETKDALPMLEEASFFDASLVPLVRKLHESRASRFGSWTMVVNAAAR